MPRLGDPCVDVGMFAADQPAPLILDTAAELARLLDLDVDRAAAWSVVWTVLQTAQAWREDQQSLDELVRTATFRRILRCWGQACNEADPWSARGGMTPFPRAGGSKLCPRARRQRPTKGDGTRR